MTSLILALIVSISSAFYSPTKVQAIQPPKIQKNIQHAVSPVPDVPFYSQFKDITSPTWQKVGCGVASLAMVIDYYKPAVSVNTLLKQGVAAGAYLESSGWTYKGLISLGKQYGLDGASYDLAKLSKAGAFAQFKGYLKDGPVVASVHYKFDPKSIVPHLVVINGIRDDSLYYNDPADTVGEKTISTADFLAAWKKRFIVMRPTASTLSFAPSLIP
jgi:ABC-type bacteriocin/lantibiotic exporter with double-glycine peptidase domain